MKFKHYLVSLAALILLSASLSAQAQTTYWDGSNTTANSTVDGGTGTWDASTTNWTSSTGASNGVWPGTTSVPTFAGVPGTVTVSGTQSVGGLTFLSSYTLTGGTLNGAAATNNITVYSGLTTVIGSVLSGNAFTKIGTGLLDLAGVNTNTGATTANAGILRISGSTGTGTVSVVGGATLTGSGTVKGATTVNSGGYYSPGNAVGTLTHAAALTLSSGSFSTFQLAQAGTTGGSCNDLSAVTGNLSLSGTLSVSAADGASGCASTFGAGQYVLFTATGTISGSFTTVSMPTGYSGTVSIDSASSPKRVLLTVTASSASTAYWDGSGTTANGAVDGGAGTWAAGTTNWTDSSGATNAAWAANSVPVFDGTAGAVTISGTQSVQGLTFNKTGYSLLGGGLNFTASQNPITVASGATVSIGNSTTGGPTFANSGANGISKEGAGTLQFYMSSVNPFGGYYGTFTVNGGRADLLPVGNGATTSQFSLAVNSGATLTMSNRNFTSTSTLSTLTVNGGTFKVINGYTGFSNPVFTDATIVANGGNPGNTAYGIFFLQGTVTASGTSQVITSTADGTVISPQTQHINIGSSAAVNGSTIFDVKSGGTFTINVPVKNYPDVTTTTASLQKIGSGTLILAATSGSNGTNTGTYTGVTQIDDGTLQLGSGGTTGEINSTAYVNVASGANFGFNRSNALTFAKVISGTGNVFQSGTGTSTLNAANTYTGTTTVNAGTLVFGSGTSDTTTTGPSTAGVIVNSGGTLRLDRHDMWGTHTSTGHSSVTVNSGTLASSSTFTTVTDPVLNSATVTLNGGKDSSFGAFAFKGTVSSTGTTNINVGTGSNNRVHIGSNSAGGSTTFNVSSGTLTVAAPLVNNFDSGAVAVSSNLVKSGVGKMVLSGASTYTGTSTVTGGSLYVNGNNAAATGAVTIQTGALLGGVGTVGGATTLQSGASYAPGQSPGTLTFSGDLTLNSGSTTFYELAKAGTSTSDTCNDLTVVGGNLTLSGSLTVTAATGVSGCSSTFGAGIYRLFNVTGTVSGNFGSVAVPAGYAGRVLIDSTTSPKQVNLLVVDASTLTYWDETANTPANLANSAVNGGTGNWSGNANWTNSAGAVNGGWPTAKVATFQGTAGIVTVDAPQTVAGLTFNTDGYTLTGSGTLIGSASSNPVTVASGVNATVEAVLAGSNDFSKAGSGKLVLTGTNTYTGGTTVSAGTLQLGAGGTSGDIGSTSSVSVSTSAVLAFNRSDPYSFAKAIGGAGSVVQSGSGTTTLAVVNSYSGGTTVSAGTLKAGVDNALPTGGAVALASGATLDLDGTQQSVSTLTAASGTVALGSNGQLTLTSGTSTLGAVTGNGKIVVGAGATLTLTQALANSGVAIELAGGTLQLGAGLTHSLGILTVTATGSVLDFASGGNAKMTFSSLDVSSGAALSVSNWTDGADLFSATVVVGNPNRDTANLAPLNRITFSGYAAANTNWRVAQDEVTPVLASAHSAPNLKLAVVSNGGTGTFSYNLAELSTNTLALTTTTAGTAVTSSPLTGTTLKGVTLTQANVPVGWPAAPASASCLDSLGASNGNGTAAFGTLSGTVLTVPAAKMIAGADITCTFTNTLGVVVSGTVFNDGGAPSGGINSGTPNNGVQDGNEAGLSGVSVALTDCASTSYASKTTDATGGYLLNVPSAQNGQTICVAATLPAGYLATGANVGGTVTPDSAATTVGAVAYTYSRASQRQSFTAPASGTLALNFALVPVSTLLSNGEQSAGPGTFATYSHRFTAGTGGTLTLGAGTGSSSPATLTGWNETFYLDSGCTGALASGATPQSPSSGITVTQGQVVCFVMREFVPAAAVSGNRNNVPVQAVFQLVQGSPGLSATYTVTDVTTVSNSAIKIDKQVRNVTAGGANAAWVTSNTAKSGDLLEYQITYTNNLAAEVTDLTIQDGTTIWTTLVSAGVGSVPAGLSCKLSTPGSSAALDCDPTVTGAGKGNVTWSFTGRLQPGASGTTNFTVKVD